MEIKNRQVFGEHLLFPEINPFPQGSHVRRSRKRNHKNLSLSGRRRLPFYISCFRKMGIEIEHTKEEILVRGKGLHGLISPTETLDVGNSGTTTRLISGILAGQDFETVLSGDASLNKRPMGRIIKPLEQMGAKDHKCEWEWMCTIED